MTTRQRFNVQDLISYNSCPNKYHYSGNKAPEYIWPEIKKLTIGFIKQCYLREMRGTKSYPQATWNWLKNQVDHTVFKTVDINNEKESDIAYKQSLEIISLLHHWYYNFFLEDVRMGYVNLHIPIHVSNSIVDCFVDIALVEPSGAIVPVFFTNNKELTLLTEKNNLKYKLGCLALWKETSIYPQSFIIKEIRGSTISVKTYKNHSSVDEINNIFNLLTCGLEKNIYYPAISEQCNSCIYKNICSV